VTSEMAHVATRQVETNTVLYTQLLLLAGRPREKENVITVHIRNHFGEMEEKKMHPIGTVF
jgi:hypothetical protein